MSMVAPKQTMLDELQTAFQRAKGSKLIVGKEDLKKTELLLKSYIPMLRVIKDLHLAKTTFNQKSAEAIVIAREITSEIHRSYKAITEFILATINNLHNPHERVILQKLYIEGWSYKKTVNYMDYGYNKDVYPIGATTVADRRRKAIKAIALSFKITGILESVPADVLEYGNEVSFSNNPRHNKI
ncbi:hypothetical protein [Paenibacillus sp. NPDC058177]|uniref:hypothetical protein n=1 Tax=Paenibacillus sp. NPDC058177 TaxID=3346369 RepID=UPI0036DE4D4C